MDFCRAGWSRPRPSRHRSPPSRLNLTGAEQRRPRPPYVGQTVTWNSDYYGVVDPSANHQGSMKITSVGHDAAGNVTSYTGLATYTS